jgi:hypothetical protein
MKPNTTYSETVGQAPFDWNKFLNKARITDKDWDDAKDRAHKWTTCACGNQCSIIPRDEIGKPEDELLTTLGGDDGFFGAIYARDVAEAKHFLELIELRSAYLISAQIDEVREDFANAVEALREVGFTAKDIADELKRLG